MTPGQRIGKARRALSPRGVRGHAPPENFEILQSQECVFLHFEAADNDFQQPKKDNFSKQFNHDLIPIPTTQIGLFCSLLIALLIIILTQSHCQHLSHNLLNAFFSGRPCSRARNTDTFQVVVYEAQFFSQCVMGRFLFLTHNERGDFMPRVIQWKYVLHTRLIKKRARL